MQSGHITPAIDIFSDPFLNVGIDYYLADAGEKKPHIIKILAGMFADALHVQRNDTEKSIKISRIANHVKDFIDRFLDDIDDLELQVKLLFNLGSHYSRNSELQLAKEKIGQAKSLFEKHNLTNQILLSNILQTYGTTHIRLGEDDQAIELLRQSLELRKTLFSPDEYDANGYNAIHHTAISYSSAFLFSKKTVELKSDAIFILIDAISHFEKAFAANPVSNYLAYQIAEGYMLMGHFYRLTGNYAESEINLNKSLAIYNSHFKNGHIDVVRVYNFLALVSIAQEKDETAAAYFQQAIVEADKIPGHNHHLYETYYHFSQLANKTNPAQAYEYMAQCAKVCKAVYGENHPTSLTVESDKVKLREALDAPHDLQKKLYANSANLRQFKPAALTQSSSPPPPKNGHSIGYK